MTTNTSTLASLSLSLASGLSFSIVMSVSMSLPTLLSLVTTGRVHKVSNQLFLVLKPTRNVDLADMIPVADAIEVPCRLLLTPPHLLHLVKNLDFLLY